MSTSTIISRNTDVSKYIIGNFKDDRLKKTGGLLFKYLCDKMTSCIKRLAGSRKLEVSFHRFLANDKTSIQEISKNLSLKTNENCLGKPHVLCIQDTVELNYPRQWGKKHKFGPTGNKAIKGFFAHPSLIVDASNQDVLGLSEIKTWLRTDAKLPSHKNRKLEEKESYCWIEVANKTKQLITNPKMITVISDRESDMYELLDRIPDQRTKILLRAKNNRKLVSGISLEEHMGNIDSCGSYKIQLQRITKARSPRQATLEIKYSNVSIKKPAHSYINSQSEHINLVCVEAKEVSKVPEVEKPIFWRILTTHEVEDFVKARQIVFWYSCRWLIEQVFRTLKRKGLNIEDSQIGEPNSLLKLFMLSVACAVRVMSLVNARNGSNNTNATYMFNKQELKVLNLVVKKLEGATVKQKNNHPPNTLSWVSWIIARLGGWNGYPSEAPPGPITMYRGLAKFNDYLQGWLLTQKDVCIG